MKNECMVKYYVCNIFLISKYYIIFVNYNCDVV